MFVQVERGGEGRRGKGRRGERKGWKERGGEESEWEKNSQNSIVSTIVCADHMSLFSMPVRRKEEPTYTYAATWNRSTLKEDAQ